MKVCTSPGEPAAGVGHQYGIRTGTVDDDSQQCGFLRARTTTNTGTYRFPPRRTVLRRHSLPSFPSVSELPLPQVLFQGGIQPTRAASGVYRGARPLGLIVRADIDPPPGQPRREASVLSLTPDSQ